MDIANRITSAYLNNTLQIDPWLEEHWVGPQYRQVQFEDALKWSVLGSDWTGPKAQDLTTQHFFTLLKVNAKTPSEFKLTLEVLTKRRLALQAGILEYPVLLYEDRMFWPYVAPFNQYKGQGTYCTATQGEVLVLERYTRPAQGVLWFGLFK